MAKPATHKNEKALEPQFVEYFQAKGRKVVKDDCITHDFLIEDRTVEVKFRGSDYPDVLVELFNCADPLGCPDCQKSGNKQVLVGWGHPDGYCDADFLCYVHSRNGMMTRIVTFRKKLFLKWLWEVHMTDIKTATMVPAWFGMHRTLNMIVPLKSVPKNIYEEVRLR